MLWKRIQPGKQVLSCTLAHNMQHLCTWHFETHWLCLWLLLHMLHLPAGREQAAWVWVSGLSCSGQLWIWTQSSSMLHIWRYMLYCVRSFIQGCCSQNPLCCGLRQGFPDPKTNLHIFWAALWGGLCWQIREHFARVTCLIVLLNPAGSVLICWHWQDMDELWMDAGVWRFSWLTDAVKLQAGSQQVKTIHPFRVHTQTHM